MAQVVLDTNILLLPGMLGINIDAELERILGSYTPCVAEGTIAELEDLAIGNSREAQAAKLALAITKDWQRFGDRSGHTDDDIVRFAEGNRCTVATIDKELRRRIQETDRDVITLRGKSHLERM